MTEIFREARALRSRDRARLVSKLIAADMPSIVTEDSELARRENDVRNGRVARVDASDVMREARELAGIKGDPPVLMSRQS
jgi:hypothetical protein